MRLPQNRVQVLRAISSFLYQFEMRRIAPGKKAARKEATPEVSVAVARSSFPIRSMNLLTSLNETEEESSQQSSDEVVSDSGAVGRKQSQRREISRLT